MSRIDPVQAPYDDELQAAFDAITPAGRTPLLLFRTVAKSRRIYRRFRAGGLLDPGSLSLREREIVILRICGLNRCEYEWGVHVSVFAAKAGLTVGQVAATAAPTTSSTTETSTTGVSADVDPPDLADWAENEQALLAACDEMNATTRLSDPTWKRLRRHFDEEQVLEVTALVGFYRTVCLHANVLELPPEPFAARFPALPAM